MRGRLLVFDWDGTLLDSIAAIVDCTRATLAELQLPQPDDQVVRGSIGLGFEELVPLWVPGSDGDLALRVRAVFRRHWLATYRHRHAPFPGVAAMLDELRGRGHLLAVATGKARPGLDRDLAATGLGSRFAATRTVSEAPSKPHPAMLLGILEELQVGAGEAMMIGDTTHDLEMAAAAGVEAVAVTCGAHSRTALEALAPAGCLDAVADLPGWLG